MWIRPDFIKGIMVYIPLHFQKPETFFKNPDFSKVPTFKSPDFITKPRLFQKPETLLKNPDF